MDFAIGTGEGEGVTVNELVELYVRYSNEMKDDDEMEEEARDWFRRLERGVILSLTRERHAVIATGGGAFVDDEVREVLKATAVVVHLDAPFDLLWQRAKPSGDRPLLAGDSQRARELYERRRPIYRQAHATVDATRDVDLIAGDIVEVFHALGGVA